MSQNSLFTLSAAGPASYLTLHDVYVPSQFQLNDFDVRFRNVAFRKDQIVSFGYTMHQSQTVGIYYLDLYVNGTVHRYTLQSAHRATYEGYAQELRRIILGPDYIGSK